MPLDESWNDFGMVLKLAGIDDGRMLGVVGMVGMILEWL